MADFDLTATLARWREAADGEWAAPAEERLRIAIEIGGLTINDVRWIRHAADLIGAVSPLLAAVEAVLKLAGEWEEIPFADLEAGATAAKVREAITAALAGTARENVSASSAATGEDGEP